MEDCRTPTLSQMMEFKYELTPTMVFDPSRLQEAQSLFVNRINVRCFTPTMKNFQSPGLSPINECTQTMLGGVAVGVVATVKEEYFKAPMKPKSAHPKQMLTHQQQQQQPQQQQQQQQQQLCQHLVHEKNTYSAHFVSDSPPVFTLNSTTNSDTDFGVEVASPDSSAILSNINNNNNHSVSSSNISNDATFTNSNNNTGNVSKNLSNTNLLDRTMNVSTLLRSIGLEQYTESFEEQELYLEQFLNIRAEDFQRLGVHNAEHQRKLLDLLSELNGA